MINYNILQVSLNIIVLCNLYIRYLYIDIYIIKIEIIIADLIKL